MRWFFVADDPEHGGELWSMLIETVAPTIAATVPTLVRGTLTATVTATDDVTPAPLLALRCRVDTRRHGDPDIRVPIDLLHSLGLVAAHVHFRIRRARSRAGGVRVGARPGRGWQCVGVERGSVHRHADRRPVAVRRRRPCSARPFRYRLRGTTPPPSGWRSTGRDTRCWSGCVRTRSIRTRGGFRSGPAIPAARGAPPSPSHRPARTRATRRSRLMTTVTPSWCGTRSTALIAASTHGGYPGPARWGRSRCCRRPG